MTTSTQNNNFEFVPAIVNPSDLKPHPILIELGYNYTLKDTDENDKYFIKMMEYFNHYDKPVIDPDNHVITHWHEVAAAAANRKSALDAYKVDMTINQLRQFIYLKHKYYNKNLIASFNTIKFYEDYLLNDPDGIELANSLSGTTREKIAFLMQTSDSTVKRIKEVGVNKPEKLGLIEQGYTSFKEVTAEIKAERLAASTEARKVAMAATTPAPTPANEYYAEPETTPIGITEPVAADEYYVANPAENESDILPDGLADEQYYDEVENDDVPVQSSQPKFEDFNCIFSSAGLGQFEISVSDNVPTVTINGEELKNISYSVNVDEKNSNGTAHSFILSQPGKNALCIQLTVENLSKAA